MSFGLVGLKQHMDQQGLQTMGKVAQTQEQNRLANEQLKQAERGQQVSAVGTGAGIGFIAGGPAGAAIGAALGFLSTELF